METPNVNPQPELAPDGGLPTTSCSVSSWTRENAAHYLECFQAEMREWMSHQKLSSETDVTLRAFAFCLGERMAGRDPIRFLTPKTATEPKAEAKAPAQWWIVDRNRDGAKLRGPYASERIAGAVRDERDRNGMFDTANLCVIPQNVCRLAHADENQSNQ